MEKYTKIITGFVSQEYIKLPDGTFACQSQEFFSGDQIDYEDEIGNNINHKVNTKKEVYQEIELIQPQNYPNSLKFICPNCGKNRLECCEEGQYSSEVFNINEEGDFEYGPINVIFGEVSKFQCLYCGYILQSGDTSINENMDVVEWIKNNCNPDKPYIDPRYLDDNADEYENE